MIAYLKGNLLEKGSESLVLEVAGVGYELFVAPGALARLPGPGAPAELFVSESVAMYGGGVTLYGFPSREEREIFHTFRDHVPSTGAKKALEYLDKASRSLPDFRRAILDGDARILAEVFGFTRKTAEKLIAGLKDKLGEVGLGGPERLRRADAALGGAYDRALEALASLGYRPAEARGALQTVSSELAGRTPTVEDLIKLALKRL